MKVVTYATHSEGSFEKLVNNSYGVEVTVLGWGAKWNGFMDKINSVLEYIKILDSDELVVFVDGFDSFIMKPLDGLEETFKSFGCDVLVSKNTDYDHFSYVWEKVFGKCKEGVTANSGLYMGYASSLVLFLTLVKDEKSSDDQRNMNMACKKFPSLKIDTEYVILQNMIPGKEEDTNAYFLSTPGVRTYSRVLRGLREYTPFFLPEILLVILLLYLAFLHFVLKK